MCKTSIIFLSLSIFTRSGAVPIDIQQIPQPGPDEIIIVNGPLYKNGRIDLSVKHGKRSKESRIQVYVYDGNRPPLTTIPRSAALDPGEWQRFRAAAGPFDKREYKMPLVISVGTGTRKLNVFGPVNWGDIVGVRVLKAPKNDPESVGGYEWECVGSPECVNASKNPAT